MKGSNKIESTIKTGNDDVEVNESSVNQSSSGLDLHGLVSRKQQSVYLRFADVSLPSDAEITNAYISFTSRERSKENCQLSITGILGDGGALPTAASDYKAMKSTNAKVDMTAPTVTTDQVFKTDNLSGIITEMLGQNKDLENYIFKVDGDQKGSFIMRSYNSSAAKAPKLVVEYKSNGGEYVATMDNSKNDAEEYGPSLSMDYSSSVKIGGYRSSSMSDSNKSRAAFRFPDVEIPENATISEAYLELTGDSTTSANTTSNMQIRVELGDGGQYTSTKGNISNRKYGATWVPFQMDAIKTKGNVYKTGNLASIIDEARLSGWKSGDALSFLFDGDAYVGGVYEGGTSKAPKLVIRYKYGSQSMKDTIVQDSKDIENIFINELSAEGTKTSKEGWAELYNNNDYPVMLSKGTYITDKAKKPEKFEFDGLYIPAKGFRVVYFDKKTDQGVDHGNFSLDGNGELILSAKNGLGITRTLDKFEYGAHSYDQSYGRKTDGGSSVVLFQNDSFNRSNGAGKESYAIKVSRDRGVYDTGFSLTASSEAGTEIRYTTDGSEPSSTKGTVYTGPIKIDKSSIVKFFAYDKNGNSGVQPYTYILKDNLKNETTSGSKWKYKSSITDAEYGQALSDFPIVSVAGDAKELKKIDGYFQSTVEFLGSHVNEGNYVGSVGARKFGQVSASQYNAGINLRFKRDYGNKKAKFKFFPKATPGDKYPVVKKFGKLQMKEGQDGPQNDIYGLGYNRYSEQATMTLAQQMGKFSLHTRYVHYYYNGQYMGVKTLREDFGDNSFEEYFGGDSSDYTKINFQDGRFTSGKVETGDGDPELLKKIKAAASSGNLQEWKKYVDMEDYINTQILFMFIDTEREMDGVLHNDAYNGNGVKMISNINDTDGAFHNDNKTGTSSGALAGGGGNYRHKWSSTSRKGSGEMFAKFSGDSTSATAGNLEFKTRVKDQVLKQIGPASGDFKGAKGAPLSVDNVKAVLNSNISELDHSYKLDAAFMSARSNMYQNWKTYQTKVLNQVDDRVKFSLESWLKYGMAHTLDAVKLQESGGGIVLQNPNSSTDVYYTTDGSDPMGADGKVSTKAEKYTQGTVIPDDAKVVARPFTTNNWGPITSN